MRTRNTILLILAVLASQAGAQEPRKEATCTPSGKPPRFESNEFGDQGWWVDDCDIARLSKNTPTRDIKDNLVAGTRICRWKKRPEGLCYDFTHDGTTGDTAIPLRTRPEFDSAIRMVKRTPEFDVCLVNWQWVSPAESGYLPAAPRPNACGVHQYIEGDVCQEISSDPPPAGFRYCVSRCAGLQQGPNQDMEIDNGPCVAHGPPDFNVPDDPCWPFGCEVNPESPPVTAPETPRVNPPPAQPPATPVYGPVVCTDHYPRNLCDVYLHWFDRTTIDAAGGRFWVAWLRDNGMTTADTEFLRHFQNGCGNEDCHTMCAKDPDVPKCETMYLSE